jgi:hypothetical protein
LVATLRQTRPRILDRRVSIESASDDQYGAVQLANVIHGPELRCANTDARWHLEEQERRAQ